MKATILFLALLLAACPPARSASGPEIIDLGEVQVDGEVRKPMAAALQGTAALREAILNELIATEVKHFEEELLRAAP